MHGGSKLHFSRSALILTVHPAHLSLGIACFPQLHKCERAMHSSPLSSPETHACKKFVTARPPAQRSGSSAFTPAPVVTPRSYCTARNAARTYLATTSKHCCGVVFSAEKREPDVLLRASNASRNATSEVLLVYPTSELRSAGCCGGRRNNRMSWRRHLRSV